MKISAIVPVYKVEKYLNQCVESILSQTFTDFELILVDDGSPDNCPAMCDAWAEKDSRIKVIHQKNTGVTQARKNGCAVASGEYITFVDADDYISADMFEILLQYARTENADYVQGGFEYVWKNRHLPVTYPGCTYDHRQIKNDIIPGYICGRSDIVPGYTWGYICRRNIVKDCLAKVPSHIVIREDRIMLLHILNNIDKLAVVPARPVYYYRQREDSAIKTDTKTHEKNLEFWQVFLGIAADYDYDGGKVEERLDEEYLGGVFREFFSTASPAEKTSAIKECADRLSDKKILLNPPGADMIKRIIGISIYTHTYPALIRIYGLLKNRGNNE